MVVALGSAAGGAVPLPGASLAVDTAIVMREVEFSLDDKTSKENVRSLEIAVEYLKGNLS
jgi:hypothetical protein